MAKIALVHDIQALEHLPCDDLDIRLGDIALQDETGEIPTDDILHGDENTRFVFKPSEKAHEILWMLYIEFVNRPMCAQ